MRRAAADRRATVAVRIPLCRQNGRRPSRVFLERSWAPLSRSPDTMFDEDHPSVANHPVEKAEPVRSVPVAAPAPRGDFVPEPCRS